MMDQHSRNQQFAASGAATVSSAQAQAIYATGSGTTRPGVFAAVAQMIRRAANRYLEAYEFRRTVSALSSLDSRTLQDIGIDRSAIKFVAMQAVREGRRN
jgi:uncharacterized protein YjiS (DUF1127 family)